MRQCLWLANRADGWNPNLPCHKIITWKDLTVETLHVLWGQRFGQKKNIWSSHFDKWEEHIPEMILVDLDVLWCWLWNPRWKSGQWRDMEAEAQGCGRWQGTHFPCKHQQGYPSTISMRSNEKHGMLKGDSERPALDVIAAYAEAWRPNL